MDNLTLTKHFSGFSTQYYNSNQQKWCAEANLIKLNCPVIHKGQIEKIYRSFFFFSWIMVNLANVYKLILL